MVIGPNEALDIIVEKEKPLIKEMEKLIDRAILERYDGQGSMTVDIRTEGLRGNVIKALLDKYRNAGWSEAVFESDQKDGTYIRLSKQPSYRPSYSQWGDH